MIEIMASCVLNLTKISYCIYFDRYHDESQFQFILTEKENLRTKEACCFSVEEVICVWRRLCALTVLPLY